MSIIRYNQEDIVPLTLTVLAISSKAYLVIAFKFAAKYHLKDLEGLVDTDNDIDEEDLKLLRSLNDEIIAMILSAVESTVAAWTEIDENFLYSLNKKEIDSRQKKLAAELYQHFMVDFFYRGESRIKIEGIDEDDYEQNLLIYINSLIIIVNALQDLILTGQVDMEEYDNRYGLVRQWGPDIDKGDLQSSVLRVLKEFATSLYQHRLEFLRYYARER
jgi:hypothetical protein